MPRLTRSGLCFASFAAMTLLVAALCKHDPDSTSVSPSIDNWDIPQLAVYLNRMGIEVHLRAIPRYAPLGRSAYLTTTKKKWSDLNALSKNPKRIQDWQGILYCERVGESNPARLYLLEQWRDSCLVAGPFIFYGDQELRERVRHALASIETPTTP